MFKKFCVAIVANQSRSTGIPFSGDLRPPLQIDGSVLAKNSQILVSQNVVSLGSLLTSSFE